MKALRNSGYKYLKYRVYGKPLGYGILGAHVSDNTITLSLIIKDNKRENIIWKSAEREFHDYQSCVSLIQSTKSYSKNSNEKKQQSTDQIRTISHEW